MGLELRWNRRGEICGSRSAGGAAVCCKLRRFAVRFADSLGYFGKSASIYFDISVPKVVLYERASGIIVKSPP